MAAAVAGSSLSVARTVRQSTGVPCFSKCSVLAVNERRESVRWFSTCRRCSGESAISARMHLDSLM